MANIGQALMGPTVPMQGTPVPTEQVSRWQAFRNKLQNDPNLRMALMTAGLNMMRTPQRGETGFDTFSQGALTGLNTLDQLRQRDQRQLLEAEDRDEERRSTRVREGQADERIDVARSQVAATEARTVQSAEQFSQNLEIAKQRLELDKQKAADARARGGSTPITGQERTTNKLVDALVVASPDVYPDTPEGRAKALLRVSGMTGDNNDPLGQARIIAGLYSDIAGTNVFLETPLTEQEMENRAVALFRLFSGDFGGEGEADPAPQADVIHPLHGTGKVTDNGDGTFTVVFPSGSKTLTKAQLDQVREQNAN